MVMFVPLYVHTTRICRHYSQQVEEPKRVVVCSLPQDPRRVIYMLSVSKPPSTTRASEKPRNNTCWPAATLKDEHITLHNKPYKNMRCPSNVQNGN